MKKLISSILFISILAISANAGAFSFISSKLSGGGTTPSIDTEVEAHGFDFRQYTWIDPAGRVCTSIFTGQKGGAVDCDFPPKSFNYSDFMDRAKD